MPSSQYWMNTRDLSDQMNYLFYTNTDFVSSGFVGYIYNNTISAPITTDISPRCVAYEENNVLANDGKWTENVAMYPNPATSHIFISSVEPVDVYIYNAIGELNLSTMYLLLFKSIR